LRMKRIQNADKLNFKIFALKYAQARHVWALNPLSI
jgi:hypothetical protein